MDQFDIKTALQQLSIVLDTLNPDRIEPVLQEIEPYLESGELKTVRYEVDNFDFDAAKAEVEKLIETLAEGQ